MAFDPVSVLSLIVKTFDFLTRGGWSLVGAAVHAQVSLAPEDLMKPEDRTNHEEILTFADRSPSLPPSISVRPYKNDPKHDPPSYLNPLVEPVTPP
ncbi:hypothetical protein NWFMUON74_56930 [Nocardia wallacei]|uniref:Uncharacterized protein n=1 Tax=Nocardia wallacei TaxID=480035 RepID=A0A7G1KSP3_9NOCA|nr:hypothetical protein NWFMUON74_56930 [Nocardia wallacei]